MKNQENKEPKNEYNLEDRISLRNHFAGLALQGIMAANLERYRLGQGEWSTDDKARRSFNIADSMVKRSEL